MATGIKRVPQTRRANLVRAGGESEISAVDLELIRHLQADGRMSFVDLAQKLNIAEKTVRKRVAELRTSDLIEITAVTDPRAIGYKSLAMLGLKIDRETTRAALAEALFSIAAVDYAVTTLGAYDVLVELHCRDDHELGTIIDTEIRTIAGVRELDVFPYLSLHYQQPAWDKVQAKASERQTAGGIAAVDATDRDIIRHLSNDGRLAFLEIARQLDMSESQVRKRYARLVEQGALQVLAITNPRSIGYMTTAWLCMTTLPSASITEIAGTLAGFSSVAYLAICAGTFDLMVEVICRDRDDLFSLLNGNIREVAGIASVKTLLCEDFLYRRVVPIEE